MILYHTTSESQLFQRRTDRERNPVGRPVFDSTHFVFSAEPMRGMGPFVYRIDIAEAEAEPYAFTNVFRAERVTSYAIPWERVVQCAPTRLTYEDITGTPWNHLTVDVLDRHHRKGERHLIGTWAVVWASRPGVATVRVQGKSELQMTVEVVLSEDFDPTRDYVVSETHEEFDQMAGPMQKESWVLTSLAGLPPQWQIFPIAWHEWVHTERVQLSAMQYMKRVMPRFAKAMDEAQTLATKHNRARVWREIADDMSRVLTEQRGQFATLGKFAGHSWTAVEAIPLRVAKRLGGHLGEEWVPPIPQPDFQNPDESGRVVLANHFGAYPTQGPGVTHSTADRPFERRERELTREPHRPPAGDFTTRPTQRR